MLRGVPFTWTFSLFPQWLFVNILLIASYYALDRVLHLEEPAENVRRDDTEVKALYVLGRRHLVFLLMVVLAVALVPSVDLHAIDAGTALWHQWIPWREITMLGAGGLSLVLGSNEVRYVHNEFSWGPILEVAALFIGIFLAMVPALRVLGQLAPKLPLNDVTFFLFSGGLSALLDNAPTYATFFEMAQTLGSGMSGAALVAGVPVGFLTAISLGSVFWGAMTYIGNGPNFMVKAVAEDSGVSMPSFGGYIVWSGRHLLPTLLAMMCLFIAGQWWAKAVGVVLTLLVLAGAARNLARARRLEAATAA